MEKHKLKVEEKSKISYTCILNIELIWTEDNFNSIYTGLALLMFICLYN